MSPRSVASCLLIAALAAASSACYLDNLFNKSPTSPTDSSSTSVRSYIGTWGGPALAGTASPQTCGGLQWKITSQNETQITGDFTASCGGGITLSGTVVATISSTTTIPWAASGSAIQGTTSCSFTMSGTGTFQGTSDIVVTYAGKACGVDVSGSQTITRS